MTFRDHLVRYRGQILELNEVQLGQLEFHFETLLKWNRVINLSAVRDPVEIIERHYCESLFLAAHLPKGEFAIVDLGSGAGFPGVPVAVARPECQVTLVESHQRRAVFLRESTRGIPNVSVLPHRASEVAGTFNWLISRAVDVTGFREDLKHLASSVALLTSAKENVPLVLDNVEFQPPIPLPWGSERILLIGCST